MALLQLVEQGKVKLDDPVETILPELKNREIISGGKKRKSSMPITLRMLLSHTSGLSYTFFNEDIKKLSQASGIDEFGGTFDGIDTPLVHEPGERFTYGVGIDWAGLLLERVTGMQLGAYIEKHIFEPLGVKDSTFDLDKRPDLAKRLTHLNYRNPEGKVSARRELFATYGFVANACRTLPDRKEAALPQWRWRHVQQRQGIRQAAVAAHQRRQRLQRSSDPEARDGQAGFRRPAVAHKGAARRRHPFLHT
jgi:CubicO group peptidase (beta-lactamase class C family)